MWYLAACLLAMRVVLAEILIKDVDRLVDRLTLNALGPSDTFPQALTVIEAYRSAPSCHRQAATGLIQACEAIPAEAKVEVMVQETKELFAVRIAICELDADETTQSNVVPSACKEFHPTTCTEASTSWTRYWQPPEKQSIAAEKQCFPATSRKQVRSCIKALQNHPQSWTSYSNALQNVGVVCQATRNAREKDELLNVHRAMTQTSQGLQTAYEAALRQGMDFTHATRQLHNDIMREARHGMQALAADAVQARDDLRDAFMNLSLDLFQKGGQFSDIMNIWNEQATRATEATSNIMSNIFAADDTALSLSRNMQVVSYHAIDLQGVLIDMLDKVDRTNEQMQTVVAMHESVTSSLTNSTAEIEKIVAKHSHASHYQADLRTVAMLLAATVAATHYAPFVATRVILPSCIMLFVGFEAYSWVMHVGPSVIMRLLHSA